LNELLWAPVLILAVLGIGIYLSFGIRFLQIIGLAFILIRRGSLMHQVSDSPDSRPDVRRPYGLYPQGNGQKMEVFGWNLCCFGGEAGMGRIKWLWFLIAVSIMLAGCATPAYKEIFDGASFGNWQQFSADKDRLYKATLRSVVAKNFMIEKDDKENGSLLAKRYFQKGR
jgi:hypothetical protein